MLDRRFQILLDEATFARLSEFANERGVSVARLIREAIRRSYPPTSSRRARAAEQILSAPDMPVPEPSELRRELERLRSRRR